MEIKFFEETPQPREEVRIKQLGLYLYPDRRRVQVGFVLTAFGERPSLQVTITNPQGQEVGSLHVIETLETNFSLTMHLRDKEPADSYTVTATLYYATPETEREDVHTISRVLDGTRVGEQ
jgi:hypothetical protein